MTPEQTDQVYDLGRGARHGLASSMMLVDQIMHVARQAKGLAPAPRASLPPVLVLLTAGLVSTALVGAGYPEKPMTAPYATPGLDFARGNRAMQDRDWPAAIRLFRHAHANGGDPERVLSRLAEAQYYAGLSGDARLTADALDAVVVGSPHGAYVRGLIELDEGRPAAAAREFDEAVRCGHPQARLMLARCR